ncbi:MAG: hypothetical protein WBA24_14375, partial [Geitlerinemataceae cyanobacterium]
MNYELTPSTTIEIDSEIEKGTQNPEQKEFSEKGAPPLVGTDEFVRRHNGADVAQISQMLAALGLSQMEEPIDRVVPPTIRLQHPLQLPEALSESAALSELKTIASQNQIYRSFIGMGYHDCITPPVILRNILENPGWYTAYT